MSAKLKLILLSSAVILSGCGTAKNALGLDRNNPDEHTVIEREPLTLPPNFNEMPEPTPGALRPGEETPQEKAKKAILGTSEKTKPQQSSAEKELLEHAGKSDDNIRQTVDKEARQDKKEKSIIKDFVGIEDEKDGDVIDANEEYKKVHGKSHPTAEK